MNSMDDIFVYEPESWLTTLPEFQREIIRKLHSQDNSYEHIAIAWISVSTPMTAPFGVEKGHSIFFSKILDELEALFAGDEKYKSTRIAILKEEGAVQTYIVLLISGALAPVFNTSSPFLAPIIALVMVTVAKVGINAWLAKRKEERENKANGEEEQGNTDSI